MQRNHPSGTLIMMHDEDELDEGPSDEDIERFGGETALCPDCGAPIWDSAEVCPKCYAYVGGDTGRETAAQAQFRQKSTLLLIIMLVIGLFVTALLCKFAF
jgi:hypothetical protein